MKKSISFNSDLANVELVEKFVNNICEFEEIDERFYGNILLALTEAVNNAIEHGNGNQSSLDVTVSYSKDGEIIEFIVRDQGRGFDYTKVPDPTLPENLEKLTGRGIFLLTQLSDNVDFRQGGSEVCLTFMVGQEVLVD